MPRTYKPVEVTAIQWAKVLRLIVDEGNAGIALSALATKLGLESVTAELEKSITILQRRGDVRLMMGRDPNTKRPTRFVQSISSEPSLRERAGGVRKPDPEE